MGQVSAQPLDVVISSLGADYGNGPVLRDVSLTVAPGEIVALLGPSGCGKTTLLRCVAGLEAPTSGTIAIGGHVVSRARAVLAPEKRRVGMVFQDGGLFPHLTVAANVGYGLPRAERRGPIVTDMLARVGLSGMEGRFPGTLSGGQQQRVALARALAPQPGVLLLDEPFSSLDAALRVQLRADIGTLLRNVGITVLFVTHDQQEALTFGDRVAVMRAGAIEQVCPPAELYAAPASAWVASFVGEANVLPGVAGDGRADTLLGALPVDGRSQGEVDVLCRPEQLELVAGGPAVVEGVEYFGQDSRFAVRFDDGTVVTVRAPGAPRLRVGETATVRFRADRAHAWPRAAAHPSALPSVLHTGSAR